MPGGRKRLLSAALLLPVVLFSVMATSFALWRCQDGVARTACCCPAQASAAADSRAAADPAEPARISAARCCDREQHEIDRAPAEAARGKSDADGVAAAAALPIGPAPALERTGVARALDDRWTGRPTPAGRSLVVQKQAFLI